MYEINLVFLIFFYKRRFWYRRPAMVSCLVVKRHPVPKDAVELDEGAASRKGSCSESVNTFLPSSVRYGNQSNTRRLALAPVGDARGSAAEKNAVAVGDSRPLRGCSCSFLQLSASFSCRSSPHQRRPYLTRLKNVAAASRNAVAVATCGGHLRMFEPE